MAQQPQFTGGAIDLGALADKKERKPDGFEPFITVDEATVEEQVFPVSYTHLTLPTNREV